jgi:hypothetical protein
MEQKGWVGVEWLWLIGRAGYNGELENTLERCIPSLDWVHGVQLK